MVTFVGAALGALRPVVRRDRHASAKPRSASLAKKKACTRQSIHALAPRHLDEAVGIWEPAGRGIHHPQPLGGSCRCIP
jgi:hypothetical protein